MGASCEWACDLGAEQGDLVALSVACSRGKRRLRPARRWRGLRWAVTNSASAAVTADRAMLTYLEQLLVDLHEQIAARPLLSSTRTRATCPLTRGATKVTWPLM